MPDSKDIYDHISAMVKEERERSDRHADKASRLLGILLIVTGIYGGLARSLLGFELPPTTCYEWVVLVIAGLLFASLLTSFFVLFDAVGFIRLKKLTLSEQLLKTMETIENDDFYSQMCQRLREDYQLNRLQMDRRTRVIQIGYQGIAVSVVLLAALVVTVTLEQWFY